MVAVAAHELRLQLRLPLRCGLDLLPTSERVVRPATLRAGPCCRRRLASFPLLSQRSFYREPTIVPPDLLRAEPPSRSRSDPSFTKRVALTPIRQNASRHSGGRFDIVSAELMMARQALRENRGSEDDLHWLLLL